MSFRLLILIVLSACSHQLTTPDNLNWVYSPYDLCQSELELCATGESRYFEQSDAQAKVNLASIFETQIKKNTDLLTMYQSTWLGSPEEKYFEVVSESVNQVIQGVEITKRAKDKGLFYSLARLDKAKARDILQRKIDKYDVEIADLLRSQKRSEMKKLLRLTLEREKLFDTIAIVSSEPITPSISLKSVFAILSKYKNPIMIDLVISSSPEWFKTSLKSFLNESGFQFKEGAEKNLAVKLKMNEEYINVPGFKKVSINLSLVTGEKKSIHYNAIETGRSIDDALLKQKTKILDYLEENISSLNLD